ncbi:MFS polyamine transporter [Auriscalpium vulgare]|uniref:MFS polyamine transporter n=1 Tax=Auriscalpium vulgare TaxID=40419 RepID=A0ACB8S1K1_9AGAM|nr:MFS polyamine transporter [Auriscalpium vulgare]
MERSGFSSPTATIVDERQPRSTSPGPQADPGKAPDVEGASEKGFIAAIVPPPIEVPDPNLVTWDGPNDPENPQNWSKGYKWVLTVIVSLLTFDATFASTGPSAATLNIAHDLHAQLEVSYLVTTLFVMGYVFGPWFWGPGSEMFGRRPITVLTMGLYTICHLGQSLAKNIQTLVVTRFFAGFFACGPLNNSGGFLVDIWDPIGRGPATSLLFSTIFLGPAVGPIVGGFITESHLGWRWIFWVMMIFAGALAVLAALFLPETYAPVLLARKAQRLRKADPVGNQALYAAHEKNPWNFRALLDRTIFRPFTMLLHEPILVLVTVYMSIVYGVIYAQFEAFPVIFVRTRGFTISQDGLVFIGVGIGSAIGALLNLYFTRQYPALMKTWRGFPPAEERLWGAMVGGPSLVVGILWLGWTGNYASVPWYVPALSTIAIGASVCLIFMSFLSYLVDTYLMFAASAFAANTIARSAVGAVFPLFTTQMFEGMGINWAATLLGLVSLVLAPIPFLFYKYGPRIRSHSKYAPCMDLKIAKQIEAEQRAAEQGDQKA